MPKRMNAEMVEWVEGQETFDVDQPKWIGDDVPLVACLKARLADDDKAFDGFSDTTRGMVENLVAVASGELLRKLMEMDPKTVKLHEINAALGSAGKLWIEALKLCLSYTAGRPRQPRDEIRTEELLPEVIFLGKDTPMVTLPLPENEVENGQRARD